MDRRRFFATSLCAMLITAGAARADYLDYRPGLVSQHLAAGDTVLLDFSAKWCSTCAAQDRVLSGLRAATPDYDRHITFIRVDWSVYGNSEITQALNIPRRSTLVVLKGEEELGRIIAQTRRARIKSLLDTALAAATG